MADRRRHRRRRDAYVVANGYGADPAASTDRVLMERDPYAVLEGLAIAAYAIGATEAIIAVRAEATEAIRAARGGDRGGRGGGFLGPDILGPGCDLTVTVRPSRAPTCWARRPSC